jgi:dienelactone hydrolase
MPETEQALKSTDEIAVADGKWTDFKPVGEEPTVGLILYPGGRVDWRAYAPLAEDIAKNGILVSIVKMPFNLAVFGIDKAGDVIAAHPEISRWFVGGHSLGGVMAASFAYQNQNLLDGVIFLAAYPAETTDLSNTSLKALTLIASEDLNVTQELTGKAKKLLPEDAVQLEIIGGNHAQFGWYGDQPGDGIATISREQQLEVISTAIIKFIAP